MKKIIYIALTFIVLVSVIAFAAVKMQRAEDERDGVAELFIGNVQGVSEQDISMCQSSYVNGGRYFNKTKYFTLECSKRHINVDINHDQEE